MARHSNEFTVRTMLNYAALPAPTLIARSEAVFVSVADIDDVGEWLARLGGQITVTTVPGGIELWTLTTSTPRTDGTGVKVLVSTSLPAGELVMDFIRAAVAR
ncbi:hypothetical protein CTZ27_37135 [Streptomyces griseocarneus]|nr:hypothetical protein CTZ27_37135 [Streptomyces griseocarneus]